MYKKDLHWWGLQSLCELWGVAAKQSMAVTFQVKCGSLLGVEGGMDGLGGGGCREGRGRWAYLAGECHHHNRSRQCHTLVTEQRPVCHLTQQPNDKDASPSGFVMSGRTAPLCPSFTAPASPAHHLILITEGDWRESGPCGEHKAPSSVTNDQNTKVNTPLVI